MNGKSHLRECHLLYYFSALVPQIPPTSYPSGLKHSRCYYNVYFNSMLQDSNKRANHFFFIQKKKKKKKGTQLSRSVSLFHQTSFMSYALLGRRGTHIISSGSQCSSSPPEQQRPQSHSFVLPRQGECGCTLKSNIKSRVYYQCCLGFLLFKESLSAKFS